MERFYRQDSIHAVDGGIIVRPLRMASASHQREGYRCCCEERAWEESRPKNAGQACLYLRNVAMYALRSGWDIVTWSGQPSVLHAIVQLKNASLIEVAA